MTELQEKMEISSLPLSEFELLCLLARSPRHRVIESSVISLSERFDWNLFFSLAEYHGVQQMVYWHLKNLQDAVLSGSDVLAKLELYTFAVIANNALMDKYTAELATLFNANQVSAVFLKGPFLSEMLYGNAGLRTSADIDVFVRDDDLSKTLTLIELQGWIPDPHAPSAAANFKFLASGASRQLMDQFRFFLSADEVCLDLHWRLEPQRLYATLESQVITATQQRQSGGYSLTTLDPEALFAFLCLHGCKHRWGRLAWLVDLAEWLHCYEHSADWQKISTLLQGKERALRLTATLLRKLLRRHVPITADRDSVVEKLSEQLIEGMQLMQERQWTGAARILFDVRMETTLTGKAEVLAFIVRPAVGDWLKFPLPKPLWSLYWAAHVVKFIVVRIPRFIRRLASGALGKGFTTNGRASLQSTAKATGPNAKSGTGSQ
jgi:hypothetical protein